jgi:hypothetical protein
MNATFTYSPLPPGHIRVLQGNRVCNGAVYELHTRLLDDCLRFRAISYAWGPASSNAKYKMQWGGVAGHKQPFPSCCRRQSSQVSLMNCRYGQMLYVSIIATTPKKPSKCATLVLCIAWPRRLSCGSVRLALTATLRWTLFAQCPEKRL